MANGHSARVETVADRLKRARELRGLGFNELDRLAKVSIGTTSRTEGGQRGKDTGGGYADKLRKLAVALRVNPDWLMTGKLPMELVAEDESIAGLPPEQASAIRFITEAGYPPQVIERMKRRRSGRKLTHDEWIDRARMWKGEWDAAGAFDEDRLDETATEQHMAVPRRAKRKA